MKQFVKQFTSKSGQLGFEVYKDPTYITGFMKDLSAIKSEEYLDYLGKLGDAMAEFNTGRFLLDTSSMSGYSLGLRAVAVNNLNKLIIAKAPFFVLAILKGDNLFENLGLQTALKMALPLSTKFLAGKMFGSTVNEREAAVKWLIEFPPPL
jgi:hypothetical protein